MGAGDLWLQDGRVSGSAAPADSVVRDGRIETVGGAPAGWEGPIVDARGHLVLPGLVDGHAHDDKPLWGGAWRPHSAGAGLAALIENERMERRGLPPVSERAAALFETYSANGTTLIRTHVDVDLDDGVAAVEDVLEAAAQFRDRLDVEVVAFPQSGMLIAPGTADLLEAAVEAGAALVGGIDPAGLDGDAVAHLDAVFGIADRRGCGVDVHLHDRGTLGRWQVGLIVERTRAQGVVVGTGTDRFRLDHVPGAADIQVGDRVVTSGIEGIYPKGFVVGQIESIDRQAGQVSTVVVRPAVDFSELETVLVVVTPPAGEAQ